MADSKQVFLDKYNPTRNQKTAISKAWQAALGRNPLYPKTTSNQHDERQKIKSAWAEKVMLLATIPMISSEYENAFLSLKGEMNAEFGHAFLAPNGFRVSHAQKGLSVYMKHLWCMGVINEPPQCPVDANILSELARNKKYAHFKKLRWTKIDDIETHRQIISAIQDVAVGQPIAQWELDIFKPTQCPVT